MIATNERPLGAYTSLVRHAQDPKLNSIAGGPEGTEAWQTLLVPPYSRLVTDGKGNYRALPIHSAFSTFNLLPNATSLLAGKDDAYVALGDATVVIARAAKGGVNIKTKGTPATTNQAMVAGVSGSLSAALPLTAGARPALRCRVNLTQITLQLFSATLDQTITAVDPTASAGDGAGFLFDPTNATTTGLAAAIYQNNWLAYQKVDGADTFFDTGVPVVAGADVDLDVVYNKDLVPSWFINGDQVALNTPAAGDPAVTLGAAGTSGVTLGVLLGVKIIDAGSPLQHDFDLRYLSAERSIG